MKNNSLYSTTTRCLGEKNNITNFKNGLKMIEKSNFKNANLNFFEIQELLDNDNYIEILENIIKECNIVFNIAHASIHFPFFFNDYYSLNKKDLYEQRILKSIELASKIGVKWIVIHIGTFLNEYGKYDIKKSMSENITYLNKFVEYGIKHHINIAIENGTQMANEVTPSIDELICIVDYFNNFYNKEVIGICFDFGHANVAKLDIYDEIRKIGNRLKITHIHDNYGSDTHGFPFDGDIDWKLVSRALKDINYCGELTLEARYKDNIFDEELINETYLLLSNIFNS